MGRPKLADKCSIPGCEAQGLMVRGLCHKHYWRLRTHGDPLITRRVFDDPVACFWSKVDRRGDDECWHWTGSLVPEGYGQQRIAGKSVRAHRFSYELHIGPIPAGLELDHICHNEAAARGECTGKPCLHRRCVNPAHLVPKTHQANAVASPLHHGGKTCCPNGHPYDKRKANGDRYCSICRLARRIANGETSGRGKGWRRHGVN